MSKKPFLPRTDLEKLDWLKNFTSKLPTYSVKYNISSDEVTDMQNSLTAFNYWMDYRKQFEEYLRKLTEYKNELINGVPIGASDSVAPSVPTIIGAPAAVSAGIFKRAASIANVIKKKAAYTIADGNDLGIEGAESTTNIQEMKPILNIVLVAGGKPEIKWKKQGMDAIEIFVDRGTGNWQMLAIDTYPDYLDNFDLPASGSSSVWKYKAIYRYDDAQVGIWSDVVSVTVAG